MTLTPQLNQDEHKQFQVLIDTRLDEITRATIDANANAGTVILDQSSVGRLSRMDAMQQQAMASGLQATLQREKLRLEAARTRLAKGIFGICCQCGELIAKPRMEADPGTPFCATCQNNLEEGH